MEGHYISSILEGQDIVCVSAVNLAKPRKFGSVKDKSSAFTACKIKTGVQQSFQHGHRLCTYEVLMGSHRNQ